MTLPMAILRSTPSTFDLSYLRSQAGVARSLTPAWFVTASIFIGQTLKPIKQPTLTDYGQLINVSRFGMKGLNSLELRWQNG